MYLPDLCSLTNSVPTVVEIIELRILPYRLPSQCNQRESDIAIVNQRFLQFIVGKIFDEMLVGEDYFYFVLLTKGNKTEAKLLTKSEEPFRAVAKHFRNIRGTGHVRN